MLQFFLLMCDFSQPIPVHYPGRQDTAVIVSAPACQQRGTDMRGGPQRIPGHHRRSFLSRLIDFGRLLRISRNPYEVILFEIISAGWPTAHGDLPRLPEPRPAIAAL